MRKRFITVALAPMLALATYYSAAAADLTGTWAVTPAATTGKIYFEMTVGDTNGHDHSRSGSDYTPAAVGLTSQQLSGPGHHITFTIARDAGSFACDGWVADGRGGGSVTFTPSADFIKKMNARGYDPTDDQIASAATVDLTNAFIDGLASAGVEKPSFHDLIAMRALNVDGPYVTDLHSVGINVTGPHDLIELRALKVDAAYVKTIAALGYSDLSSHQLVQMRAMQIDAAYIRKVQAHGIAHPTVEELIRLKAMNVI